MLASHVCSSDHTISYESVTFPVTCSCISTFFGQQPELRAGPHSKSTLDDSLTFQTSLLTTTV